MCPSIHAGIGGYVFIIHPTNQPTNTPTPTTTTTVQLLHKLKVRSADGKATLLKVVKNPISRHLPPGCKVYGMSVTGNLYNPMALACALPESKPVVFVIGAMAAGHITVAQHPYVRTLADRLRGPGFTWGFNFIRAHQFIMFHH